MRFPKWKWDAGAMAALLEREGYEYDGDFERECRLRSGRLEDWAEGPRMPLLWEFQRMALALDMTMDELFDEVFRTEGDQ